MIETYKIRDTRFGRKPRNAVEALRQVRDFLAIQGKDHWIKGRAFSVQENLLREHKFDPKDSTCSQWGVCAVGALALVTGQTEVVVSEMRAYPLIPYIAWSPYDMAEMWLEGASCRPVVEFNDDPSTSLADVIKTFDKAIELARENANARRGETAAITKRDRALGQQAVA